jgi:hypothetical protein
MYFRFVSSGSLRGVGGARRRFRRDRGHHSPRTRCEDSIGDHTGIGVGTIDLVLAQARDSMGGIKSQVLPRGSSPYVLAPFTVGTKVLSSAGISFTAESKATINTTPIEGTLGLVAAWSDLGSFATVTPHLPPSPPPEDASATFIVIDPLVIDGIADATAVTFETTIGTGASLLLEAGPPAAGYTGISAVYSGFDTTTLNGIGELWSWTWSASSATPGFSDFSFVSNPALGLDDAALVSEFKSVVTYDPMAGVYGLSRDFDVTATVDVLPGQTSFIYGGGNEGDVQAAVVPEASTWAMAVLGFASLGFLGLRQRVTARTGRQDVQLARSRI